MLERIIPHNKLKEFTTSDNTKIFYREWEGRRHKNVIIYFHGLESHMEWFLETGTALNGKGFHVYAVDRRGSGKSHGERGHMENYRILINDIKEIVELARSAHPGKKIYLMGLCWSGKIAVTFAADHQDIIDGLILVTPAIKTKADLTFPQKLDVIFSNLVMPKKLIDVPLKAHMFTRNPKYLEFIKNDKLKLKKATARFFFETGKMNLRFNEIARKIHIPVLVLLAGDDVIIDNEETEKWFTNISSKDKAIKTYPGIYHCLQFEDDKKNFINYLTDWIRQEESLVEEKYIERSN